MLESFGFSCSCGKFCHHFGLNYKLSYLVFGATKQLSLTLQYREINTQEISNIEF